MKKIFLTTFIVAISFGLGFALNSVISHSFKSKNNMKKVTGIGGIFFKCQDPHKVKEWYKEHLGIDAGDYGKNFEWREEEDSSKKGLTVWNPFPDKTKYFEPSQKEFMINYRVENLEALVEQFKKSGVTMTDTLESYSYGKFIHIMDPEGNKIELWEPIDKE